MDNPTKSEQALFSKWYGVPNIAFNGNFWDDVFEQYSKDATNVILPIAFNPQSVRMALEMLDCPPGKCGECCHYGRIPVLQNDVERITRAGFSQEQVLDKCTIVDKKVYFSGENGCPFLKDNACSIYKFRPDGCYLFPLQNPIEAEVDGRRIQQMTIRIKCLPALEVARKIIVRALDENTILLPNLTIVKKGE